MLTQKLTLSYLSRLLLQFIQVVVTIVVARVAGPSVLGTIAFGVAFVNMFAFIADLGIPTAYIKSINDGDDEAKANGTFIRIQAVLLSLFIITVAAWLLIQKYGFHYRFESKTHEYVIVVLLFAMTIQRAFQTIKAFFIARTQQAKQDVPNLIQMLIYQALRLTVVLLGYKALAIAFSNLAATILIIPFYIYLFKNYSIGKFDKLLAKKYFKISVPVIIILIANTVLANADKVILQYYSDSKIVGYYTAGFRIGGFVLMIANVIGLLFFPLFTKAVKENNISFINDKINKYERFMFLIVFPFTVFAAIYSDVIVKLILGSTYLPTIPILSVITLSMFFLTLFQPYGNVILAKGHFYYGAFIFLGELFIFVILAFVVVNPHIMNKGGLGMAMVIFIVQFITGLIFVLVSKKNEKQLKVFQSGKLIIFAVVFSFIAFAVYLFIPDNYFYKSIYALLFFVLFWLLLFVFGLMQQQDIIMIKNVASIKKMRNYIKRELKNKQ